jgi:hypothetical protein
MSAVTKPVTSVVKKAGEAITKPFKDKQETAASPLAEMAKMATGKSASAADETIAARRRARRGGRALLSEQRLTPEQGVGQSTLGVGQM